MKPSVLLFDLGGVLVENGTRTDLMTLLPEPMEPGALFERWLDSPSVRAFEIGQTTADRFADDFIAEWGLSLEAEAFIERFAAWPRGPYPGVAEFLAALRPDYTIAYLSNCNDIHWRRLEDLRRHADHAFSSHELGVVKPDAAIFERVVEALGYQAGQICFFDDSARNVRAAQEAGMQAHQTVGFEALKARLAELGLAAA